MVIQATGKPAMLIIFFCKNLFCTFVVDFLIMCFKGESLGTSFLTKFHFLEFAGFIKTWSEDKFCMKWSLAVRMTKDISVKVFTAVKPRYKAEWLWLQKVIMSPPSYTAFAESENTNIGELNLNFILQASSTSRYPLGQGDEIASVQISPLK